MGQNISTRVRAIRLPHTLWSLIEAESEVSGDTVNKVVSKRLEKSFSHLSQLRKTENYDQQAITEGSLGEVFK